ncbi:HNH endonuclease [Brachybacterium muris]|nr:HNH endonuclease signature motif containing protein [Brachybacterium muris]
MEPQLPPDEDTAPGTGRPAGDALSLVLERTADLPRSGAVRNVVAEVMVRTLAAFTATISVMDPVPDTAPGSSQEALAVVAGIEQLRAGIAALDASWQVTTENRIRESDAAHDVREQDQGRAAAHEVALARRISPSSSSMSLASARRLVAQMPATYLQLAEGRLPERNVQAITRALDNARPETCALIDQWVEEDPTRMDGLGTRRTTQLVREMAQALDPGDSRARAERAARKRNVTMEPLGDGMARISATLRALDASAVMKHLHAGAEASRAAGARDSFGALQADHLVASIVGGPTELDPTLPAPTASAPGARLDVGVVITDRALLGCADEAEHARIEGYGPVPAHIITDALLGRPPGTITPKAPERGCGEHTDTSAAAVFRRLYSHPVTGELVAMESRARAFPVGLARMIRWRDQTCRTPWCNARIRHLDHIAPHARGGATSYDNGQGLCARCNYLKEHGQWSVHRTTTPSPVASSPVAPSPAVDPTAIRWASPHGARGISPTPPSEPPPPPRSAQLEPPPGPTHEHGATSTPPTPPRLEFDDPPF